jgi:hypothetical protein
MTPFSAFAMQPIDKAVDRVRGPSTERLIVELQSG